MYKQKYLKYKQKYLELQLKRGGTLEEYKKKIKEIKEIQDNTENAKEILENAPDEIKDFFFLIKGHGLLLNTFFVVPEKTTIIFKTTSTKVSYTHFTNKIYSDYIKNIPFLRIYKEGDYLLDHEISFNMYWDKTDKNDRGFLFSGLIHLNTINEFIKLIEELKTKNFSLEDSKEEFKKKILMDKITFIKRLYDRMISTSTFDDIYAKIYNDNYILSDIEDYSKLILGFNQLGFPNQILPYDFKNNLSYIINNHSKQYPNYEKYYFIDSCRSIKSKIIFKNQLTSCKDKFNDDCKFNDLINDHFNFLKIQIPDIDTFDNTSEEEITDLKRQSTLANENFNNTYLNRNQIINFIKDNNDLLRVKYSRIIKLINEYINKRENVTFDYICNILYLLSSKKIDGKICEEELRRIEEEERKRVIVEEFNKQKRDREDKEREREDKERERVIVEEFNKQKKSFLINSLYRYIYNETGRINIYLGEYNKIINVTTIDSYKNDLRSTLVKMDNKINKIYEIFKNVNTEKFDRNFHRKIRSTIVYTIFNKINENQTDTTFPDTNYNDIIKIYELKIIQEEKKIKNFNREKTEIKVILDDIYSINFLFWENN